MKEYLGSSTIMLIITPKSVHSNHWMPYPYCEYFVSARTDLPKSYGDALAPARQSTCVREDTNSWEVASYEDAEILVWN